MNPAASSAGMPTAIILAGGFGTRLRSIVADVPKPMAPVSDRPFLAYLLDCLDRAGFERAVLSVGYKAEIIRDYFGARYRGLELIYCIEAEPLGTGGAIRTALSACNADSALVLNGDTYQELDYAAFVEFHRRQPDAPSMTLALRRIEDASRYGAVTMDEADRVVGFAEKSRSGEGLINAGIYLIERGTFDEYALPEKFSFENDFMAPHCARLRPRGFVVDGYMIDIGTPEDFERAQHELPARIAAA